MESVYFTNIPHAPLCSYLKALGIFRAISSQVSTKCLSHWHNGAFSITSPFSETEILQFFEASYQPTPIVAPWNGGSGFFESDNQVAKNLIKISILPRLERFKEVILAAETAVSSIGLVAKPETKEQKTALLIACRNTFPNQALDWLDAAVVMTDQGAKYPPLLGTGGNDGRLEFTNNFMQRITEVFGLAGKKEAELSQVWLKNALFGTVIPGLTKSPIGQFHPGNAGGANATTGFDSDSLMNPWDFILMMEGALLFAGASVRRLNASRGDGLAYPFTVRQSGTGYGTSSFSDEHETQSRAEMWMPIWEEPCSLREIERLFSEGRAEVNGRPAANGVDFTRAVVSLGVDRGITEFQRYGFLVRNGLAYFATPLDRVRVKRNPDADLIAEIDPWLKQFRRRATQETPTPPASMKLALRRIEDGIIRFCKNPEPANVQNLFIALGEGEKSLNSSQKWTLENQLKPLGGLSPRWLELANDGSTEFRLAASLGSMVSRFGNEWLAFRAHLEPIRSTKKSISWQPQSHCDVVWHDGEVIDVMNRIFQRRLQIEGRLNSEEVVHIARIPAQLGDIAQFIEGRTDDAKLSKLLWAMILVDFSKKKIRLGKTSGLKFNPPSIFALLRSCFPRAQDIASQADHKTVVPLTPNIHRRAVDGFGTEASQLAARRLFASGLSPAIREIAYQNTARIAAAMLFPLTAKSESKLLRSIQRPSTLDLSEAQADQQPESITA